MPSLVDFHSHVLPKLDDGSGSVEESIAMLKAQAAQGITCVVATPHFYAKHDHLDSFLERRKESEARLREKMAEHTDLPQLIIGAEVLYFPGIGHTESISKLVIGDTDYILIEMPLPPWTDAMYRELEAIYTLRGLNPIIAHVDRYIGPFRTHRIPQRLMELPVMVQANAEFFLNRSTAAMAIRMLRQDQIHLLGTDCHDLTTRSPNMEPAVKRIKQRLGDEAMSRIDQYSRSVIPVK